MPGSWAFTPPSVEQDTVWRIKASCTRVSGEAAARFRVEQRRMRLSRLPLPRMLHAPILLAWRVLFPPSMEPVESCEWGEPILVTEG